MSHERYYILQIYRESFLEQLTYFYRVLLPTSRLSNSWLSKRSRSGVFSFSKLKTFVEFWTSAWFLSIFSISIYSWSFSSVFFSFSLLSPLKHATRSSTKFKRKSVVLDAVEDVVKEMLHIYHALPASLFCRFLNFKVDSSIRPKWIVQSCPGTNSLLFTRKLSQQFQINFSSANIL